MQIIFEKRSRFYGDLETVYLPIEVCTVTPKLSILTRALQRFCLIHEFVSFKLDHCNSLLYGLPFSVVGPKLWNDLPLEVRQSANISAFKRALKDTLI